MAVATIDIGELLVSRPDVWGGRLCMRGTRVPVHTVAARYNTGESVDEMLLDWPHTTRAAIHAALAYYFANHEQIEADLAADEAEGDRLIAEQEAAWRREGRLPVTPD